jgi:purine catabolism regulator
MVKVANDPAVFGAELTSDRPEVVAGLALGVVVTLPGLRASVIAGVDRDLQRPVTRASVVRPDPFDDACLDHHLVVTSAETVSGIGSVTRWIDHLASHGATALAVAGPSVPHDVVEAATGVGLPVVHIRGGGPDDVVVTVLGALLDHQSGILHREEEAHRVLVQNVLGGGSLQDLCHHVAGFYAGAAVVTTSDGRVLASAGVDEELEHALALDCFDRTGRLMTESEAIGLRDPSATRAMVRIVAGSLDHGRLLASCSHRALSAEDVHLLERAATVAALAITKDQAVSAVESKYRAEFLRDALSGRAGSPDDAVAHARSLGWDLGRRLVVVVAETDEDDVDTTRSADEVRYLQERFARAWTHAMRVRDPRTPVMGFSQEVVALIPVPDDADTEAVMRTVAEFVQVVRGDGGGGRRTFSTGVSRPITSIDELPQAYEEAMSAVTVGRQMHGESSLAHFDGLGIYRLLALVPDSADLRRFVVESLGELATDESPENEDLRRTLSLLIDTNMNVAETARLLFFHYNTLRYRIAKLERMLGPFTSDPQLRLTLALALKVHQMRGI